MEHYVHSTDALQQPYPQTLAYLQRIHFAMRCLGLLLCDLQKITYVVHIGLFHHHECHRPLRTMWRTWQSSKIHHAPARVHIFAEIKKSVCSILVKSRCLHAVKHVNPRSGSKSQQYLTCTELQPLILTRCWHTEQFVMKYCTMLWHRIADLKMLYGQLRRAGSTPSDLWPPSCVIYAQDKDKVCASIVTLFRKEKSSS